MATGIAGEGAMPEAEWAIGTVAPEWYGPGFSAYQDRYPDIAFDNIVSKPYRLQNKARAEAEKEIKNRKKQVPNYCTSKQDFHWAPQQANGKYVAYYLCGSPRELVLPVTFSAGKIDPVLKHSSKLSGYKKIGPVVGIGVEGKMPVFSLGLKAWGWTGTGFYGTGNIKQDPTSTFTQTAPDALGYYKQKLDYHEFDSSVTRLGGELSKDLGKRWNLLAGMRRDQVCETYNGLQTLRTLKNGVILATQQKNQTGEENITITYTTFGLGYRPSDTLTLDARALLPLKIKKSSLGNKYGEISIGAMISLKVF